MRDRRPTMRCSERRHRGAVAIGCPRGPVAELRFVRRHRYIMCTFTTIKWVNRHAASLAVLLILLWVGAGTHWMAITRLGMTGGRLPVMDAANESRVRIITYIDAHRWVVLPYAIVFGACLVWLELRQAPRRAVLCAFGCLALPTFGYMWVCLRVANEHLIRRM